MRDQRRKDTTPELSLRRVLHASGARYRVNYPVPGLPRRSIDIAFPKQRVAVFVDGCFWHGCPTHAVAPKHNGEWWAAKLAGNALRDAATSRHLEALGWTVIRVWEHVIAEDAAALIRTRLNSGTLPLSGGTVRQ